MQSQPGLTGLKASSFSLILTSGDGAQDRGFISLVHSGLNVDIIVKMNRRQVKFTRKHSKHIVNINPDIFEI